MREFSAKFTNNRHNKAFSYSNSGSSLSSRNYFAVQHLWPLLGKIRRKFTCSDR